MMNILEIVIGIGLVLIGILLVFLSIRGWKALSLIILPLLLCLSACTTSQQTTTYNALASLEATADTSYSNYVALVIKGTISTNSLPQVSKAYNDLHAGIIAAAAIDQSGTNVFAPPNLTVELTDLVNLIAVTTQTH